MIHPDRVLHFLATRRPVGETDLRDTPGWPDVTDRSGFTGFFAHPADAVEHLEVAFGLSQRIASYLEDGADEEDLERAAGAYIMGVRALTLSPEDMPRRRLALLEAAALIQGHLLQDTGLIHRGAVGASVDELARRLKKTGDVELAAEGMALELAAGAARGDAGFVTRTRRRKGRRTGRPALPSAAYDEVFPEDGDLTAEQAFRLLVEQALADGVVDTFEWTSLRGLGHELGIPALRRDLLEQEAANHGEDEDAAPLDLVAYMEALRTEAERDGQVTPGERRLLDRVGRYLCVDL
jgi:hypothetical protein